MSTRASALAPCQEEWSKLRGEGGTSCRRRAHAIRIANRIARRACDQRRPATQEAMRWSFRGWLAGDKLTIAFPVVVRQSCKWSTLRRPSESVLIASATPQGRVATSIKPPDTGGGSMASVASRKIVVKADLEFTVTPAKFEPSASLELIDAGKAASRKKIEVGEFIGGCCATKVYGVVQRGMVTRVEFGKCKDMKSPSRSLAAAAAKALKAARRGGGGGFRRCPSPRSSPRPGAGSISSTSAAAACDLHRRRLLLLLRAGSRHDLRNADRRESECGVNRAVDDVTVPLTTSPLKLRKRPNTADMTVPGTVS